MVRAVHCADDDCIRLCFRNHPVKLVGKIGRAWSHVEGFGELLVVPVHACLAEIAEGNKVGGSAVGDCQSVNKHTGTCARADKGISYTRAHSYTPRF